MAKIFHDHEGSGSNRAPDPSGSWNRPRFRRGSGWFPAPPVVVLANDGFTVARHTTRPVVGVPAEFTRLIARSRIAERMAADLRGGRGCRSRGRGGGGGGRRRGRGGDVRR